MKGFIPSSKGGDLDNTKAVVVLSGGQDSATCLALACQTHPTVYTISFMYGQRHRIELDCAARLSDIAGAKKHNLVEVSSLRQLGGSALLQEGDIGAKHALSNDLPASFVPGRNYIFLGLAAAWAFQLRVNHIYTGVCQTDYSGYPDCRQRAITAIQDALYWAMDWPFLINTPLMHLTKKETVLMMQSMGRISWYSNTHTCYEGQRPPCGKCPACILREKGFKEAGIKDPLVEI